ncbi:MAG TPA: hypothetical protein VIN03_05805 [Roseateles sp.]
MKTLPGQIARDLRGRLRDAHVATYNTLNTIFTGGLVAYLLRRVLEMPAAQRPWLLVLASLLVIIACWSGLFRMLALVRYPSRITDALLSFANAFAVYVMVTLLDGNPRAWLQAAAAVAFLGGLGTLSMLHGGRSDPFNDDVLALMGQDLRRTGFTRMAFAPLMLLLAASPLPDQVLSACAVLGAVLALVADDFVWGRAVAQATHRELVADERASRPSPLGGADEARR